MQIIKETFVQKVEPNTPNVNWVDTSDSQSPRLKVFVDGAWTNSSGASEEEVKRYAEEVCISKDSIDTAVTEKPDDTTVPSTNAVNEILKDKISEPVIAGTEGQILQLDAELKPIWATVQGEAITPDVSMSDISTNAVQNKVIKQYVDTGLSTKTDQEQSGDKKYEEESKTLTPNVGGVKGPCNIGSTLNISDSNGYRYYIIPVTPGELYEVHTYISPSENYKRYVVFVNDSNVIVGRCPESTYEYKWMTYTITVPTGATNMYVTTVSLSEVIPDVYVKKLTLVSLQDQIDAIPSVDTTLSKGSNNPISNKAVATKTATTQILNDRTMFVKDMDRTWIQTYLNGLYDTSEATAYNALVSTIGARTGLKLLMCSDTHFGEGYLQRPTGPVTAERSIRVFNRLAAGITGLSGVIHGGDISCDYGTSANRILAYIREVIERFTPSVPFFITKGNHDENNNVYAEVNHLDADFSKETYYTRAFDTFTAVTMADWDGSQLYRYQKELVTDDEFVRTVQKYHCPSSAVWGNGAYYYYDFADSKVRFIVLNSFPVIVYNNARIVVEGPEYKWFAETALDLSGKETPSDWSVIILRHSHAVGITLFSDIITAFTTGGSVSGTKDNVSWSKDYSTQGAGNLIAVIHGHEHAYIYRDTDGYNSIGFPMSNCKVVDMGDASKYGICGITIDTANRNLYIDDISGDSYQYTY